MVTLLTPGQRYQVEVNTEFFNAEAPSAEELAILTKNIDYISAGNSFLQSLFADHYVLIKDALAIAKNELSAPFIGLGAGDSQIAMQLIRQVYVLRTTGTTETPATSWVFTLTSGDDYWIGFSTNNTTPINVDKRVLLVPMAVLFTQGGTPTVEEISFTVGATTYPASVIRHAWTADNSNRVRAARMRPMIWKPKSRVLARTYSRIASSDQELVLVGLAFVMGDLARLRTDEISAVQT